MAVSYDRAQIRAALNSNDPSISAYLDFETGTVVLIREDDLSATANQLRDAVTAGYGDRYRYIPGGVASADDAAVSAWLEAEGL